MRTQGVFPVWSYAIGQDATLSVIASEFRTLATDSPAVLIVCEDEAEQQELLAKVTELLRTERSAA